MAADIEMEDGDIVVDGMLIDVGVGVITPVSYCLFDSRMRSTTLNASGEEILYEVPASFARIQPGTIITVGLEALLSVTAGSIGTYRVYVGGSTPGSTAGATLVMEVQVTSSSLVIVDGSGIMASPTGIKLIQVTGINNTPTSCVSYIGSATVSFT